MKADPERRARLLQLAAGAAFLALAAVLVLIVLGGSGGSGGDTKLEGAAEVGRLLDGIPQEKMVLGDPEAPVKLTEFGDLQCPVCKGYSEEILPPIFERQVEQGEVRIEFRNYTIIGEQSLAAGAAALAAGEQGRGWNYVELFYRNQGEENSGYADDAFLRAVARAAGVKDLPRWERDRKALAAEVEKSSGEAAGLGFDGTPSFAIQGPGSDGMEPIETPDTAAALEEAIEAAS
jgi:protein-disulfide isomerase